MSGISWSQKVCALFFAKNLNFKRSSNFKQITEMIAVCLV